MAKMSRRPEFQFLHRTPSNASIKEHQPVGDGVHLVQMQAVPLMQTPPFVLVHKVTVLGSHVLRYVSRNSNDYMRRQVRQYFPFTHSSHHNSLGSHDTSLVHDLDTLVSNESSSGMMNHSSSQERGCCNWRIYIGVALLLLAETLLKLSFQEIFLR